MFLTGGGRTPGIPSPPFWPFVPCSPLELISKTPVTTSQKTSTKNRKGIRQTPFLNGVLEPGGGGVELFLLA